VPILVRICGRYLKIAEGAKLQKKKSISHLQELFLHWNYSYLVSQVTGQLPGVYYTELLLTR